MITCSGIYRTFKNQFYNGIRDVTVWRVLRKRLHLKAYKLSIVQHLERSGSGFPSIAPLVLIFYLVTATCFGLMTIFRRSVALDGNPEPDLVHAT
jgi:hypothetical protein